MQQLARCWRRPPGSSRVSPPSRRRARLVRGESGARKRRPLRSAASRSRLHCRAAVPSWRSLRQNRMLWRDVPRVAPGPARPRFPDRMLGMHAAPARAKPGVDRSLLVGEEDAMLRVAASQRVHRALTVESSIDAQRRVAAEGSGNLALDDPSVALHEMVGHECTRTSDVITRPQPPLSWLQS